MKVVDFKGNEYSFPPEKHVPSIDDQVKRSGLHIRCRNLLGRLYPTHKVLEEVELPGTRLTLDFYLPHSHTAIEVHGEQHYKFNSHFHNSRFGYARQQQNDVLKKEWCKFNDIGLIVLPFNKTDEEWRELIWPSCQMS